MSLKKMRLTGITRAALVGLGLVGLAAGAMMFAQRGPGVLAKMTGAVSAAQDAPAPEPKQLLMAAAPTTERVAKATPARTAPATPATKPSVVMASATIPAANAPEIITLTGCLQHDDGTFRLKNTSGQDAPKSRSWKSGFLKKGAASVEVVDSANRLGLPTHVGQRVTVTGVMLNKEMRARAVQRVGVCS